MSTSKLIFAVTAILVCSLGQAQEFATSFKSTEVVPGMYMIEGEGGFGGGNMALVVGDDGPILIDDGLEPLAPLLLESIKAITEEPIEFVVNTHVHGDHLGGNEALHMQGATVVAHDNIRRRLVETGRMTAAGQVPVASAALPEVTFSDSVTFHSNGFESYVFHVEHAHTDGDAVIFYRNVNVIHTGDVLFNGMFPFIDLDSGGSVPGYLEAQERILSMADDETKIVPGHGPLASKADLRASTDMIWDAQSRVKALVDAGRSEEEIVTENPLADLHDDWDWGFITTERMTRTLYRSLTQAE